MNTRIMIMESEDDILNILCFAIGREGYEIICTKDGLEGVAMLDTQLVDVILIDLKPPMDSIQTYQCLQEEGVRTPCIVFAKEGEQHVFKDENCIVMPFSMPVLLRKIKEKTRSARYTGTYDTRIPMPSKLRTIGRFTIDPNPQRSVVYKDGIPVKLTSREHDLLVYMFQEPGKIFGREELLSEVWGYSYWGDMRQIDVTIRRLRKKIEDDPEHPSILLTQRGVGYYITS